FLAGQGYEVAVFQEGQEFQGGAAAGLEGAEDVTLAAHAEVVLGEFETIRCGGDDVEAFAAGGAGGEFGDQQADSGGAAAADATAQLVQLAHAEAFGVQDDHGGGVGDI